MSGKKKTLYYTQPLFEELRKDYCYVCGQRIKKDSGIYIGNNTWRHKKCKPGSSHWLKSTVQSHASCLMPHAADPTT